MNKDPNKNHPNMIFHHGAGVSVEPAIWKTAQYPGDHVRRIDLRRGDEIGFVTIQDYLECAKERYRVGTFLPGVEEWSPGDTPKTWPEKSEYFAHKVEANAFFLLYVKEAVDDGWKEK